jgi:hyperosmotically inducible periplasmic protein
MRVLLTLSILGILALSGCSRSGTSAAGPSNADLEQAIKTKMAAEPELGGALSVSVAVDNSEVTLSGTVPSESLREEAIQIAKSSRDGLIVIDKIDVKPRELSRSEYTADMAREAREKAKAIGETVGDSIDDAWIYTKVMAKLIGNSETPARKIDVDVVNKVVTLRGHVDNAAAKEEAERVARETEGVERVRNLLKVAAG